MSRCVIVGGADIQNYAFIREKLCADVLSRLETVESIVAEIEKSAPQRVEAYREKLYAKLQTVLADKQVDDARILTEAAIFADRVAIDEETTRLHSHISHALLSPHFIGSLHKIS